MSKVTTLYTKPVVIDWEKLEQAFLTITLKYIDGPYAIHFSTNMYKKKKINFNEEIGILNIPYFIDVPNQLVNRPKMIKELEIRFPWLEFYTENSLQYIFISIKATDKEIDDIVKGF